MIFQEKIKKLRNYLFGFEDVVFSICYGDYLKDIGYKISKLGLAIYFKDKKSFKELIELLGFIASKFYENIELIYLNEKLESYSPVFLMNLLDTGATLFVKNQKLLDKWSVNVINYYYDTSKVREKFYYV